MRKWVALVAVGLGLFLVTQVVAQPPRCCWWLAIQNAPEKTIQGTVVGYAWPGLIIQTDEGEEVVVYGIGPWWFWRSQGITRPRRGEEITVTVYELALKNGQTCLIAKEIETKQGTLKLRDAETGLPLWSGPMRNRSMMRNR